MKKYDPLWHEINTLLAHLRAFNVVCLVDSHFFKFGNAVPGCSLWDQINRLQKKLDDATEG